MHMWIMNCYYTTEQQTACAQDNGELFCFITSAKWQSTLTDLATGRHVCFVEVWFNGLIFGGFPKMYAVTMGS